MDEGIARTLHVLNERFELSGYAGLEKSKALIDVRYIGKGILKMMQSLGVADNAPDAANQLWDPLLNICTFLAMKVHELDPTVIDEDVLVYLLQILKGQRSEDDRIRELIGALAKYGYSKKFRAKDMKFFDTLLMFIGSMDYFSSQHREVNRLLLFLEELLLQFRSLSPSVSMLTFDANYLSRARRYGFSPYTMRYALRNLSSSQWEVMRFVLALEPWLKDYGKSTWELENIARSYLGLRRLRERVPVRNTAEADLGLRFHKCIDQIMPMHFHSLKMKDSFINSLAKCLMCLEEGDSIYKFICKELAKLFASTDHLDCSHWKMSHYVSLDAFAGLFHGIGKKKSWYKEASRRLLHAVDAAIKVGSLPYFNLDILLSSKEHEAPQSLQAYCVMISSFEGVTILYPEVTELILLLMKIIEQLMRRGLALSYGHFYFVCKGLAGFMLSIQATAFVESFEQMLIGVIEKKGVVFDQLLSLLQVDAMHFYLHRIARDQLRHEALYTAIKTALPKCNSLAQMVQLMDLVPLFTAHHRSMDAIITQLHNLVFESSSAKDILSALQHRPATSNEIGEEEFVQEVFAMNSKRFKSAVSIHTAQLAAMTLHCIQHIEGHWPLLTEAICVLLTYVIIHIDDLQSCQWHQCLSFCRTYSSSKPYFTPSLQPTIAFLQEEIARRGVRHLETLFGSYTNQTLARQTQVQMAGKEDALPYSQYLEMLLQPESSMLLSECMLLCADVDPNNSVLSERLAFEKNCLFTVYDSFYYGTFKLPESLRFGMYDDRYTCNITIPWRNVEEYATLHVKKRLMTGGNMIAWHSVITHCLMHGFPGSICLELMPIIAPEPASAEGDVDIVTMDKLIGGLAWLQEAPRQPLGLSEQTWLLLDLLPKNRYLPHVLEQKLINIASIRQTLNITYAAVLVDVTVEETIEQGNDGKPIGPSLIPIVSQDRALYRRLEQRLDRLLLAYGLCKVAVDG